MRQNPLPRYCSRFAQTVTDFADASHSESAKSTTTTVLYGIFSSGGSLDIPILKFSITYLSMNPGEFPHSEISGSMLICSSPKLIAAYHVFHRLPVPRHSPCALVRLTFQTFSWNIWYPLDSLLPTKIIVTLPFEIAIFLKKELTIIFVSQLLFSFQGTSLSSLFRALKIEQYLLYSYRASQDCPREYRERQAHRLLHCREPLEGLQCA